MNSIDQFKSAIVSNDVKTVKHYVSLHGADAERVNVTLGFNRGTALIEAANLGYRKMVGVLLSASAINVNATDRWGETALMKAASYGHIENIKRIVMTLSGDVNAVNHVGRTALSSAALYAQTETVAFLLSVDGINVNNVGQYAHTALSAAASRGHTEIVKNLLPKVGDHINTPDFMGDTALMLAAFGGYTETVNVLLSARDININAVNLEGITSLFMAIIKRHTKTAMALLAAPGIDIAHVDRFGRNALALAESYNENSSEMTKTFRAIKNHMAMTGESYGQMFAATLPEVQGLIRHRKELPCDDVIPIILGYLAPMSIKESSGLFTLEKIKQLSPAEVSAQITSKVMAAVLQNNIVLLAKLLTQAVVPPIAAALAGLRKTNCFYSEKVLWLLAELNDPKLRKQVARQAGVSNWFYDSALLKQATAINVRMRKNAESYQAALESVKPCEPVGKTLSACIAMTTLKSHGCGQLGVADEALLDSAMAHPLHLRT